MTGNIHVFGLEDIEINATLKKKKNESNKGIAMWRSTFHMDQKFPSKKNHTKHLPEWPQIVNKTSSNNIISLKIKKNKNK